MATAAFQRSQSLSQRTWSLLPALKHFIVINSDNRMKAATSLEATTPPTS